jgi:beta-glucosidase
MDWTRRASYLAAVTLGAASVITCSSLQTTPATAPAGGTTTRSASGPGAGGFGGPGFGGGGPGGGFGGGFGGGGPGGGFGGGGGGGGGRGGATRLNFPFRDATRTLDARLDDLLERLSLDEKVAQMQMDAPAIDRLGIAAYHWWNEALHGVARNGAATVFPQAIGMAASWDPDLHLKMARVIADEGRAKHAEALRRNIHAIYTGLDFWSPNINIFRDPRWGRGQETYGEDPYLTGRLGISFVQGLQGEDPNFLQTIATPKHYAVHSGPEIERHRFDAQVSEVDLFTTYLPAFEATVREGHAFSVMAAYNSVDGLPATASPRLLTDILRTTWGFQGYVTSDVDSVGDVYQNHQFAATPEAAAAAAVKAGCDLNGGTTYKSLSEAVRQGLLTEADVDQSLRRLLSARFKLGEFDPAPTATSTAPVNPYANIPPTANDTPANDAVARQMARESMVLLKNTGVLPLKKDLRTLAVIGPTADSTPALYGNYNGNAAHPITILQGLRNAVPLGTQVLYTAGCPLVTEDIPLAEPVPGACFYTDATRRVHGLYATYYRSVFAADRPIRSRIDAAIDLNFPDQAAKDSLPYSDGFYVKWTGILVPPVTGDYQLGFTARDSFRLTLDDKLIVNDWYTGNRRSSGATVHLEKDKAYAVLAEHAHPASATPATAPATAPAAPAAPRDAAYVQLKWTRPALDGQAAGANGLPLFDDALRAAQAADAVVLVLGITADLEREEAAVHFAGFSGGDRTTLDLPAVQERLLEAVTAAAPGKPVTLVLTSGSALAVNWAHEHVPAILQAWYPGQHGDAVADVLFGDYNPAGRLPVTFYKSINDLPPFTDYAMQGGSGRTYRYFKGAPLYPFGYGLSYTKFEYSKLDVTANPSTTQDVVVRVAVKNTGAVAGDEVVQVYVENPPVPAAAFLVVNTSADNQRVISANMVAAALPPKALVGFKRVPLKPGEEKTVEFTITPHQLGGALSEKKHVNVARTVTVQVAPNSGGGTGLSQKLAITGNPAEADYRFVAPKLVESAGTQP